MTALIETSPPNDELTGGTVRHTPVGLPIPAGHHAWYPLSPCGNGCLPVRDHRLGVLAAVRVIRLLINVGWWMCVGLAMAMAPRLVRRRVASRSCRHILRSVGIAVHVDDRRPFASSSRGLVVANHVSFLDVLAIAVVTPAHFVAKSDVAEMPVVSVVARWLGVLTIERNSLRRLPSTVDGVVDLLEKDRSVAVFPEGTTRCGRATGVFRPAFFQAAIDAGVPVQPMRIRYTDAGGDLDTTPSFIGADGVADTLRRVLTARGLTVHVRVHESQLPGADRRELAAQCERLTVA